MKEGIGLKRLPVLLITLLFVLVGCGTAIEPSDTQINRRFSCPITVEQKGRMYSADLTVTEQQCSAAFSYPDESKGMSLLCRNGQVSAAYTDSKEAVILPRPNQCFLYWLDRALNQTQTVKEKNENTITLQGVIDDSPFLLTICSENGQPLYFEIDSLDLTVKFQPSA